MGVTLLGLFALIVGFAAYVRFAPSDPARWHQDPAEAHAWEVGASWGEVAPRPEGAALRLPPAEGLLARLDAVAMATPHTTRLAGSVEEGRITWVTRSALWGFPDYTTAEQKADGVYLDARLRFGKSDLGVNARRLTVWRDSL